MNASSRPLAVVTGASSGIGLELSGSGASIEAVQVDLATPEGTDKLYTSLAGRPADSLLANAGHGLGRGFLDQSPRRSQSSIARWRNPVRPSSSEEFPFHSAMARPSPAERKRHTNLRRMR
jgi:short-subunit dehydrogenase